MQAKVRSELDPILDLFRIAHKPFIYGGFKHVMSDDAARALAEGRLLTDGVSAALIYDEVKAQRKYKTFDDRTILLSPGDLVVSDFACLSELAGCSILGELASRVLSPSRYGLFGSKRALWVEVYEEDAKSKRVVREGSFSYAGTKIAGSSEIKGLYRCGYNKQVDYRHPPEQAATVTKLREDFIAPDDLRKIRDELRHCDEYWDQIASNYNRRKSWSAVQLRGYLPDPKFHERPGTRQWREADQASLMLQNTEIADKFPETWRFVNMVPGEKERVRFMRLRSSDGELGRHTDLYYKNIGISDGKVARFHVPIVTDADNVIFSGWDARGSRIDKTFEEGTLFYLDFRKPHAVVNRSSVDRVHLVVDCFAYSETRRLIAEGVQLYG